ncbi:PEGA domain-containing protein [Candidatus Peregrinibacteria bacterium]|nr:PEGA domain-containing protein [Candidatus Peregrinibacteria bacterium]
MLVKYLLCAPCLVILLCGCVERKLSIRSDPPDADVYIDGEKIGKTPCELPFTFYGTRQVTIEKEGYNTVDKQVEIPAPPYGFFPFDFVFEVLIPAKIDDTREFSYVMEEEIIEEADEKEIFQRAKELKNRAFEEDEKH